MKKVGIIGGGIAGLTCGYRLVQKRIRPVIFEKSVAVGGRIPYAGAVATDKFQPKLISLIKELGLEELKVPLKVKDVGFYTSEGQFLGAEKMPILALKTFSIGENLYFMKLRKFVNKLRFDVLNPDPELIKLRKISAQDYLKNCPEKIMKMVIDPNRVFIYEDDLGKISAEYFLTHLRLGNEYGSGKAFTFEENNIMTVTNVLEAKLIEKDAQIFTSAEVKRINRRGEKFEIVYKKEGEKIEEVDTVVFALPLNEVKKIFPELNLEIDTNYYRDSKCIFVEGKLKWPERKFIIGMPGNPANLRGLFNVIPYTQLVYPIDEKKEVDLGKLYQEYKIVDEKELKPTMPVIGPTTKVPELKTDIKEVYLCGDFYYYPWLETAIATAEKVASLISEKL